MAVSRSYTPSGIYAGSGVNPGGNIARGATIHNGQPGVNQGGANMMGSARKATTPVRPGPKPPKPKPIAPAKPVKQPSFSPIPPRPEVTAQDAATRLSQSKAQQAWDAKYGVPSWVKKPSTAPVKKPSAPAAPAAPTLGGATTHDAAYWADLARARYEYDLAGNDIAELRAQVEANKPKYALGRTDLTQATMRDMYDANAALAARGIFNSGQRTFVDTQRQQGYSKNLSDLEQAYGSLAEKGLLAKINETEAQRGIMDSATGKWSGAMGAAMADAEAAALQRALEQLAANPPSQPYTNNVPGGVIDPASGKILKPINRKDVGWFKRGNQIIFRNEVGREAVVPASKATAAWLKNTKRAGV